MTPSATRPAAAGPEVSPQVPWTTALARGLAREHDYAARIDGTLPPGLRGTLYRNGPGLFERDGYRKGHVLDVDGMIRAWDFSDGGVRFRNRYVRTTKFVAEDAAGRFLHATWGTRRPGGMLANLGGGDMVSQAGVTPVLWDDRLLAFDETGLPWALDPDSLDTQGEYRVGPQLDNPAYKAHTKFDAVSGDWILLGNSYGREMQLRVVVHRADGRLRGDRVVSSPRSTYVHDFFATERYVVVNLHAVRFSPFPLLGGLRSFTDCLNWQPAEGNLVLVIDKQGSGEPHLFEAPASWMWHALNAYETDGGIVADFVGYDAPDHFLGDDPALAAIMQGRPGAPATPGTLRRWRIDLNAGRLEELLVDAGHFEFPMTDPRVATRRHRVAYLATGPVNGNWWHDGLARIDLESGDKRAFHFGPGHYVGEPVFAARPGGGVDDGWLLAEVLDGTGGAEAARSFLAVFDARDPATGPLARVRLTHHLPLSFHGTWRAAQS